MAPHLVRGLAGGDQRRVLPLSMGAGALLLVVADTVARTVAIPAEIPVGIFTALAGRTDVSVDAARRGAATGGARMTDVPALELVRLRSAVTRVPGRSFGPFDVALRAGERIAILGPSGAGKSTLLRLLAGERAVHGGEAMFRSPLACAMAGARVGAAACRAAAIACGGLRHARGTGGVAGAHRVGSRRPPGPTAGRDRGAVPPGSLRCTLDRPPLRHAVGRRTGPRATGARAGPALGCRGWAAAGWTNRSPRSTPACSSS
jgi:hypothetical protein